jgi:hypothetical protein
MYLSNRVFKYVAVSVCVMFPVITTVIADVADVYVEVEQTVKPEDNREAEDQLSKNNAERARLRTLLNFTLVGTVLSNAGKPIAILEDSRSSKQKFYRLDDRLMGMHITKILKDRVMLTKDGIEIEIRLNSGTSREAKAARTEKYNPGTDAYKSSTKPASVEELHNNGIYQVPLETLKHLSRPQEFELPEMPRYDKGFYIDSDVLEGGILGMLGLQAGDVILAVSSRVPVAGSLFSEEISQLLQQEEQVESGGKDVIRLDVERGKGVEVLYLEIQDP